ncbi:hypothetical protein FOA52_004155 [Chlamydomonas sp. UWO 241]|nr:hypothetical protein FOA52_004155 [Chlamydomonas sp. UWO 241]
MAVLVYALFVLVYLYFWFSYLIEGVPVAQIKFQPLFINAKTFIALAVATGVLTLASAVSFGLRGDTVYRGIFDVFATQYVVTTIVLASVVALAVSWTVASWDAYKDDRLHLMIISSGAFFVAIAVALVNRDGVERFIEWILSPSKPAIMDAVLDGGKDVLMVGPGGSGKSFVIRQIFDACRARGLRASVTATTGSAAFLIGGCTIHSLLGIGIQKGDKTPQRVAQEVRRRRPAIVKVLEDLELLVIDEVSMLDDRLFRFVSEYLGHVRSRTQEPFGGVQVLLSGDLYQLPPCNNDFIFKCTDLAERFEVHELTASHRHTQDPRFSAMLAQLRKGVVTPEAHAALEASRFTRLKNATYLFTKNCDVDVVNGKKLRALVEDAANPAALRTYRNKNVVNNAFAAQAKIPVEVALCVGATVMLTYNVDVGAGLCNGAQGVVTDVSGDRSVVVRFHNSPHPVTVPYVLVKPLSDEGGGNQTVEFMPVRLAYAITVDKSQGMTLDRAIIVIDDDSRTRYGKAYTALSRVRTLELASMRFSSATSAATTTKLFRPHPDVRTTMSPTLHYNRAFDEVRDYLDGPETCVECGSVVYITYRFLSYDLVDMHLSFDEAEYDRLRQRFNDVVYADLKQCLGERGGEGERGGAMREAHVRQEVTLAAGRHKIEQLAYIDIESITIKTYC